MVGRLRDNKLMLQGAGSSPIWRKEIEKRNVAAGFDITIQEDPYLPSDTTALLPKRTFPYSFSSPAATTITIARPTTLTN